MRRFHAVSVSSAIAAVLALTAVPAAAQSVSADPAELVLSSPEDQNFALREQLLASEQRIAELERRLADMQTTAAQVPDLQAKNARLAGIGQELIASYERRYRGSQWGPFQLARTRFERETQEFGDRVHASRADAVQPQNADTGEQ